jgi:N-ethylmaleimide reductase
MADYYSQRASAGLIIAEATMAMEGNSAFYTEPGIYNQAQIEGWRLVTDAVHRQGGHIFLQIWHGGRACHPLFNNGAQPVAPSPIPITSEEVYTPTGKHAHGIPRELSDSEILPIVEGFRQAAVNAQAAGFDGVEVHGANGYLIDSFLRDGSNHRTGPYGGSVANRCRFLLEVLEAVIEVWGADRTGLRISPLNSYNSMVDSDPVGLCRYLAEAISPLGLAYLHVIRADRLEQQHGDVLTPYGSILAVTWWPTWAILLPRLRPPLPQQRWMPSPLESAFWLIRTCLPGFRLALPLTRPGLILSTRLVPRVTPIIPGFRPGSPPEQVVRIG